jgi:hypothetical protein
MLMSTSMSPTYWKICTCVNTNTYLVVWQWHKLHVWTNVMWFSHFKELAIWILTFEKKLRFFECKFKPNSSKLKPFGFSYNMFFQIHKLLLLHDSKVRSNFMYTLHALQRSFVYHGKKLKTRVNIFKCTP